MKNSSKLLERICKRVRRSPRKDKASCSKPNTSRHDQLSASLQEPRGALQDSTFQTGPAMAAAEFESGISTSLSMENRVTSSAPLLRVHLAGESSQTSEVDTISTRHQECIGCDTSPSAQIMLQQQQKEGICTLSATDSGLYSEEEDCIEEDFLEVFSDEEDDEDCLMEDGWQIPAKEVSLDQVVAVNSRETVYSGYWHGNVAVHALCSNTEETYRSVLADVSTLSNIRHENIQLFLGVCHDLHTDYISIVVDQMRGESLHTIIHKQNHKFNFQSLTKITNQVAQGMEYLHAKGIPHPLLTTQSVTLHVRACISMLSPGSASMGVVNSSDLPYLAPEVMRTVAQHSSSGQAGLTCPSSPHSVRGLQSRCSSTSSRISYKLPSTTGWSTPTSPSLRRQVDSRGYLGPDVPVYAHRGSCDNLRSDAQCKQRLQLQGDTSTMQTYEANIFSFGTLLYEMLTSEKPFTSLPGNLIIYKVGNGETQDLNSLHDGRFKQTIRRCWRREPGSRPSFQELLLKFEQNMSPKSCGLKSHFSFSVPNHLDKLGCFETGGLHL